MPVRKILIFFFLFSVGPTELSILCCGTHSVCLSMLMSCFLKSICWFYLSVEPIPILVLCHSPEHSNPVRCFFV